MGLLSTLATAWRVGTETTDAVGAARSALEAGHGPLAAVRAFAAATEGQLDDRAVAELERAVRLGMTGLGHVVTAAAWVAAHEDEMRRLVGQVAEFGYRAGAWRQTLRDWEQEAKP